LKNEYLNNPYYKQSEGQKEEVTFSAAQDIIEQLKLAEKNQSNAVLFYQKFIDSFQ